MRYVFFINSAAGKYQSNRDAVINGINDYFSKNGGQYDIHITRFANDARDTARALAQTGEEITMFACGGEGTCFEILNGIYGYGNVTLGVIPCGSANDFLKFFGDEKDAFRNIENQISGESIDMDVIKAGEFYCLNGCSFGMDAFVAQDMSLFKNWPLVTGPIAYKLAIVRNFLRKIGTNAEITLNDSEIIKTNCLFAVVANAPYYGGGFMAAPDAVPYDGKLNFTLVKTISKLRVPKFLSYYEKGKHANLDYCRLCECNSMEFKADCVVPINLDGEIIRRDSMRFEIIKAGVKFQIPASVKMKILTNV